MVAYKLTRKVSYSWLHRYQCHIVIKILYVCVPVCVCITEVVSLGGRDYRSDALPSYLLYFVLHVCDNHEVDALEEHQLNRTQPGSNKLKQMKSGNSC